MRVAEHLHLDVTRVDEHLLEVQRPVAERGVCLHRGLREELGELLLGARRADPPPTSAGCGLDQHRDSRSRLRPRAPLDRGRTLGAGNRRCTRPRRESPRGDLVAHRLDRLRTGADEDQPLVAAGGREVGVLGEEAVAGVDGVGARLASPPGASLPRSGSSRGRAAARCRPPRRRGVRAVHSRSAVEKTATVWRSSSRHARITRSAISPRLAMRTFCTGGGRVSRSRAR